MVFYNQRYKYIKAYRQQSYSFHTTIHKYIKSNRQQSYAIINDTNILKPIDNNRILLSTIQIYKSL